jgi:CRP-like cAMP-binding protein
VANSRSTIKANRRLPKSAEDGKKTGNLILSGLSPEQRSQLFPAFEFVRLKLNQVLHEVGEVIKSVYFLNNGLASVLSAQPDGRTVEVGLIGNEGYVGVPVAFGFKTSSLRVVIQTDATGYRLEVPKLREMLLKFPTLERQLQRFALILSIQTAQLAACNRLHGVDGRLARWLLMSHDRIGRDVMPLTQEFLGQMLGTRRSSVSLAASILQKAGMISYTRGNVTLLDEGKLKATACECYQLIKDQTLRWRAEAK